MHNYNPANSDDDDAYAVFAKIESDPEEDPHSALTSQTLNADGTPKRPMNAFMIFARRRRPQVSAENQSMRTGDISKILSQEWKAMLPGDKQFYLTQAKQLKESFNTKYPDYVYRRRPNNTRKRRKPEASSSSRGDTDDAESSPDGEDAPPLPDAHRYPYAVDRYTSAGAGSSAGYGYAGAGYGGAGAGGHARTASYPYPQAHAHGHAGGPGDVYRSGHTLLSSAYYPPYDANAASNPQNGHTHSAGTLRRAASIPAMPSALSLSPPPGWPSPAPSSGATSNHSASNSNHSNSNGSSSGSSAGYYAPPSSASASAPYGTYAPAPTSASYPAHSHSPYPSHSPAYSAHSPPYSASPAYSASPRFDAASPVYAPSHSASPRGGFDTSPRAAAGFLDPSHSPRAAYLTPDVPRAAALGSYGSGGGGGAPIAVPAGYWRGERL